MERDRFERLERLRVRETQRGAAHGRALFESGKKIAGRDEDGSRGHSQSVYYFPLSTSLTLSMSCCRTNGFCSSA